MAPTDVMGCICVARGGAQGSKTLQSVFFYETELTGKTNLSKNCYFAPKHEILKKMTLRCYKSR
jgi:hypothetical protein